MTALLWWVGVMAAGAALAYAAARTTHWWRMGRWQCRGCGHPYTAHLAVEGGAAPCAQGAHLAGLVAGTACSCQAYLGRTPPAHLVHGAPAPPTDPAPITPEKR